MLRRRVLVFIALIVFCASPGRALAAGPGAAIDAIAADGLSCTGLAHVLDGIRLEAVRLQMDRIGAKKVNKRLAGVALLFLAPEVAAGASDTTGVSNAIERQSKRHALFSEAFVTRNCNGAAPAFPDATEAQAYVEAVSAIDKETIDARLVGLGGTWRGAGRPLPKADSGCQSFEIKLKVTGPRFRGFARSDDGRRKNLRGYIDHKGWLWSATFGLDDIDGTVMSGVYMRATCVGEYELARQ